MYVSCLGKSKSLIEHLSLMHHPSEMPYRCESCGYRTSSHKDVIDHYYKVHDKNEGLQCPYCLKVRIKDRHISQICFSFLVCQLD